MRHGHKVIASIWSTVLLAPILFVLISYARLECGEMDRCPTGGWMPYAGVAAVAAVVLAALQAAFLVMLWRRAAED